MAQESVNVQNKELEQLNAASKKVCDELSKYLNLEVKMDNDGAFYYSINKPYFGECDEIICSVGFCISEFTIDFDMDLPPRIVSSISKFYKDYGKHL